MSGRVLRQEVDFSLSFLGMPLLMRIKAQHPGRHLWCDECRQANRRPCCCKRLLACLKPIIAIVYATV